MYNRRYYLHRILKKKGICYSSFSKTIYRNHDASIDDLHITMLVNEFNYNVQFEIY